MPVSSEISVICKLTPSIQSTVFQEYLLSSDFCCPLGILINPNENVIVAEDSKVLKSFPSLSVASNPCHVHENICSCILSYLTDSEIRRIQIRMDICLYSMVMFEFNRSRQFRSNVLFNFYSLYLAKSHSSTWPKNVCRLCQKYTRTIHVYLSLYQTKKEVIDFSWNKRLQILVNELCELENAMAWLSTLGGAFSALGDTFVHCAEKAGLISMKQFQLALRLGDPITICRCKIYLAMSLLQQGYYSKTKHMVRDLYQFAIGPEGSKDFRIKNMCIAVWNRLKYVLSENRKHKSNLSLKSSSATD